MSRWATVRTVHAAGRTHRSPPLSSRPDAPRAPFILMEVYQLRYVNICPGHCKSRTPHSGFPWRGVIETWDFVHLRLYVLHLSYTVQRAQKSWRASGRGWQNVADATRIALALAQIVVVAINDQEAERLYGPHID